MDERRNPLLEPNKTVAVIIYFALTLIGGSFIITILALLYSKTQGLGLAPNEVLEIVSITQFDTLDIKYYGLYVFSNATANLIMYILLFLFVLFYMRDYLKQDAKNLIKNYKKLIWLIPLCAGIGYGISYGVEVGIGTLIQNSSVNQSSIEFLIEHGGAVSMFFAVVVCAPIIEELIYRKAIFEYLKKYPIIVSYVVSILIFMLPHMITTFIEPGHSPLDNFLLTIPYMCSGFLLCLTYHLCNKNIYASWFFHVVNNLVAFILICC